MIRLFVSALSVVIMTASASGAPDSARTSVCELARAGQRISGRSVRMTAVYVTDLLERSVLKDHRCPMAHIEPDWSLQKNPIHDPSLDEFDKALYARPDEAQPTQFLIDVSGKFVWQSGENPHGSLIFDKVWSFKRVLPPSHDGH